MRQTENLAIVIPAYKIDFLEETIESIANQTCKDFVLFIGDDASPYNLYEIVKEFENKITIRYTRFEENLGGKDLVAHWERCIDLVGCEEWVWLFSDDDIMERNCVENFFLTVNRTSSEYNLYKFNTHIIDANNDTIKKNKRQKGVLSSSAYLLSRLFYQDGSFAVEFVFRRSFYYKQNKFVNFPMAWCSDDATWYKLSGDKGVYIVDGAIVNWRLSEHNISGSLSKNKDELLKATNAYIKWLYLDLKRNDRFVFVHKIVLFYWYHLQLFTIGTINHKKQFEMSLKMFGEVVEVKNQTFFIFLYKPIVFVIKNLFKFKLI